MEIGFKHLDELCQSTWCKNTFEECLHNLVNEIEEEIPFQSMGIYLKQKNEKYYQIKIHRHLSHTFVKDHIVNDDNFLFNELKECLTIQTTDKKYQFEHDFTELLIYPISYHKMLNGFFFIDRSTFSFSPVEIAKLNVLSSLLNLLVHINNQQELIEKLNELDSVTTLYNHRAFVKHSSHFFDHMNRYNHNTSLTILKFNKFDEISQVIGNHKIPQMLKEIADIIKDCIRQTDIAGILYPDTFAIFFPEVGQGIAHKIVIRIKDSIMQSPRLNLLQQCWGIADSDQEKITFEDLLNRTEECAFYAMRDNHSKIVVYDKGEKDERQDI